MKVFNSNMTSYQHFSDINSLTYRLSVLKGISLRRLTWLKNQGKYAKTFRHKPLDHTLYQHKSLIRRKLGQVDMRLQENKATNLTLAAPRITHILIKPGETFSFWKLVGKCSKSKGYKEGLVIKSGQVDQGVGGGMCQMTNLIHWMILHSPLTITEHHHHNNIDMFPDYGRHLPFGSGTSIMYNYLDYQFRNDTDITFQLIIFTDDIYLNGKLLADKPLAHSYHIVEEDSHFQEVQLDDMESIYYRCNKIYRKVIDKNNGVEIKRTLVRQNHAKVLYDASFIPKDQIYTKI